MTHAVCNIDNTFGSLAGKHDAFDTRATQHREVAPLPDWPDIGHRRRAAASVARHGLVVARALLRGTVEVGVARNTVLPGRLNERLHHFMGLRRVGYRHRSANRMVGTRATGPLIFRAQVGLQHTLIVPSGTAQACPMRKILALPAQVDHAVDRTRSTHHLALVEGTGTVVQLGLRLYLVDPVEFRLAEHTGITDGNMQPVVLVVSTRFEQQDAIGCIRRQPVGDDTAGRTGAHNDVVELLVCVHGASWLRVIQGQSAVSRPCA